MAARAHEDGQQPKQRSSEAPGRRAPVMLETEGWSDYALLDRGNGQKLERYGAYRIVRPEEQALWSRRAARGRLGSGRRALRRHRRGRGRRPLALQAPDPGETWPMDYDGINFLGRFTAFRHVGVFPEQATHWEWMKAPDRGGTPAGQGAEPLRLYRARLAGRGQGRRGGHPYRRLEEGDRLGAREPGRWQSSADLPIRWICEDAKKFVEREMRRGNRYDGIILDPPKFGRGPNGEVVGHLPRPAGDDAELRQSPRRRRRSSSSSPPTRSAHRSWRSTNSRRSAWPARADCSNRANWCSANRAAGGRCRHRCSAGGRAWMSGEPPRPGRVLHITSLANPLVKEIRGLALPKNRKASGLFVAEGLKLVADALEAGWTVRHARPCGQACRRGAGRPAGGDGAGARWRCRRGQPGDPRQDQPARQSADRDRRVRAEADAAGGTRRRQRIRSGWRSRTSAIPAISARSSAPSMPSAGPASSSSATPSTRSRSRRCGRPWDRSSTCRSCAPAAPISSPLAGRWTRRGGRHASLRRRSTTGASTTGARSSW